MAKHSPLSTPSATREALERHGLYTKYGLGQNFLVNDDVIGRILELAEIQPSDHVLEVGPGIGTLTYALLAQGAMVTAIEKDTDLPAVLAETLEPVRERFILIPMDALALSLDDLRIEVEEGIELPNKLVSNLPYAVAATVVLDFLQRFDSLQSATVMVQKEVADRMTAKPGTKNYGAYTVKLSLYAQPVGRFPVAPGNFFPPPRVDSAVLRLDRQIALNPSGVPLSAEELGAICTMTDAAFANRRKTLSNSCKAYFSGREDVIEALPQIMDEARIDPRRRGETLSRREFIDLGLAYAGFLRSSK